MDMYGLKDKSIPQKITLFLLEIIIIGVSYWVLFRGGYDRMFSSKPIIGGNETRHIILLTFIIVLFVRTGFTMIFLLKRRMPWEEAFSIPFAFAIYYIGFTLFGYKAQADINYYDFIAILIYVFGSYLNTGSELARHRWKQKSENKGNLYTIGLFKYSMHINYFGDLLWVIAFAMITRNWYSISIVAFLFFFFAFYNIPKLDTYLASKYGQQFEDYRKRTKKFIPFIY